VVGAAVIQRCIQRLGVFCTHLESALSNLNHKLIMSKEYN
jgi:hypothetical protein